MSEKLPHFIRRRLAGRGTLQKVLSNSSWLFIEQSVRLAAGFVIGIWMARYLGPENFGWLNYAVAVVGIVGSFTGLGINAVVVRELVRSPAEKNLLLGTAAFLRGAGAAVGFLACVVIASRQGQPGSTLILVIAAGMVFQVPEVADLLFQARGEAGVSAWVRIAAFLGASIFKLGLLLAHAPLWSFAVAGVLEIALAAVGWWWAAGRRAASLTMWQVEWRRVRSLLAESWPLAVSGLAVSAQAYVDQLFLGTMVGAAELGQYAAALRLVSVFAFIPVVLQVVAAPEITRAQAVDENLYRRRLHGLYRTMFLVFVVTAVPLMVVGPWAARWMYGASYATAAGLLPLLALRMFFTNLGVARSVFITAEGLFKFSLFTATVGALVNFGLNWVWVPKWGARGAIFASFVSFGVTLFALEGFKQRPRENLRLMARAVFMPWRSFA